MSAAVEEVQGLGSTKETWALAMQYIVGRKRAEEALGFLAHTSNLLAATLDYDKAVQSLAEAAVPYAGDYCSVELLDQVGALREAGLARSSTVDAATALKIRGALHPQFDLPRYGVPKVIRECKWEILRTAHGDGRALLEPEQRLLDIGMKSALIVPIAARGHVLGAVTLVSANAGLGRHYGAGDEALMTQLALRIAAAIELGRALGSKGNAHEALSPLVNMDDRKGA